jgi:hypothetical protein
MNPNTYLPDDILRHIAAFLPPSLNVCLSCKLFYKEVTQRSYKNGIYTNIYYPNIDLLWLWNEVIHHEQPIHGTESDNISNQILQKNLVDVASQKGLMTFFTHPSVDRYISPHFYYLIATNAYKIAHLKLIEWVQRHGYNVHADRYLTFYGAYYGHLNLINWALDQGEFMTWSSQTTLVASSNGHIEVLQAMVLSRFDDIPRKWTWHPNTMSIAIANAMKTFTDADIHWLIDNGCPWNDTMLAYTGDKLGIRKEFCS